jgi:methylenetetrahydrofolate dehydrogenase (NADP+)/methenyltetrahydrofolate cyclohydrolase
MAIMLDGRQLARQLEQSMCERVEIIKAKRNGQVPVLATILVGDDPASATYVRMKGNACKRVGMESRQVLLPRATTTAELLHEIDQLNDDPRISGILLQHPVPSQINERACFDRIAIEKDVDGVTSHNFGLMSLGEPAFLAATPRGIMEILKHYEIPLAGKHSVVVGRSPILGKPMAMALLNANSTVTICHSRTQELDEIVRRADIVVGAVGKPEFIKGDWIKEGAVVIDAGYHPGNVGDIELAAVTEKAYAYTPVPGGVGPMTIASLIMQTIEAIESD